MVHRILNATSQNCAFSCPCRCAREKNLRDRLERNKLLNCLNIDNIDAKRHMLICLLISIQVGKGNK
jgi:hypothetical protein